MKKFLNFKNQGFKSSSLIQITGTNEILAEECGDVSVYDESKIVFLSKRKIIVEGEKLLMTNLERGAVAINGKISSIRFED